MEPKDNAGEKKNQPVTDHRLSGRSRAMEVQGPALDPGFGTSMVNIIAPAIGSAGARQIMAALYQHSAI